MRPFRQTDNDVCDVCGGVSGSFMVGNHEWCKCGSRRSEVGKALRQVDPEARMLFQNLKAQDETMRAAALALSEIGSCIRERGVLMMGLPGRGKTHLAVATVRMAMARGKLAGFFNVAELVSRIQSTYGYEDSRQTRRGIIEDVISHEVIVLDDLGKEHKSADVQGIIYELIDGIYRAKRTVIICSNLPGTEFVERYDDAVRSRLLGMSERFVIKGEDRRLAEWEW